MKHIAFLLLVLVLTVSCGIKNDGSSISSAEALKSALVGDWCNQSNKPETMTIGINDSFGTKNGCEVSGSFKMGENYTFTVYVTSAVTNGNTCMTVGTHECSYELKNNDYELYLRCNIDSTYYDFNFVRGTCS